MLFVLKFSIYFLLSFLILSINIENQSIFFHLTKITNPYTGSLIDKTTKLSAQLIKGSKELIEKEKIEIRN